MKILTVVGARPQFIKAWPTSTALREAAIEEIVVHTGQHYDERMSGLFFTELGLREPAVNLGIGSGTHGAQTGRMIEALEQVIAKYAPDGVLVYGDTNSTLAAALAAAKLHVPVAHVEAGLRSFNRRMPEEINRVLTDHVSTILFCPSTQAVTHLAREGITAGVQCVGDVMYDALLHFRAVAAAKSRLPASLGLAGGGYYLATIHRAENTDDPARLKSLLDALAALDAPVVLPLHPRTRACLPTIAERDNSSLRFVEPLGYLDMLAITGNAKAVLTDSGGLQKEAYWLGVRCITLREETEWTETLQHGWNQLTGIDPDKMRKALAQLPAGPRGAHYGQGDAALRIARELGRPR